MLQRLPTNSSLFLVYKKKQIEVFDAAFFSKKYAGNEIIKTHCITDQPVLCSKVLNCEHKKSVVV
jgi:hypothetical protein